MQDIQAKNTTLAPRPLWLAVALALALDMTGFVPAAHADASEAAEIAAVARAHITPIAAVTLAEKHSGGRAYGMGLEVARLGTWYEVQLDVKGQSMVARIDPHSGAFLGIEPAKGDDRIGARTLAGRKIDLVQALRAAETHAHGRALEAGPAGSGVTAHYDVDVVAAGGKLQHLSVNADNATVGVAPQSEQD
ncbi:PepSY domain-containing protein [Metallibacterium scheffleri]|uniref:PepSY domain-containing protein n=1 Tax=Metallibacterium scheffleri TaxID=993689 RepID=A0A4S3KPI1_9GAMM|nr:hypothetical protein [Metallibacterium scheffleri]THD10796.1 hypothetical protein B1806_06710 [Metallibacterium scheffleri]